MLILNTVLFKDLIVLDDYQDDSELILNTVLFKATSE